MHCSDFISAWVHAHASSPLGEPAGPAADEMREHRASCDACAALARRLRIQAGVLSTLESLTAPPELETRVSAILARDAADPAEPQAPERVARSLEHLHPVPAPPELEDRVAALLAREHQLPVEPGLRAPSVLDRLVDENLRDLPKAVSAGMLAKLERPVAPAALEQRVHADLADPTPERRGGRRRLAAAASLLALIGWMAFSGSSRSTGTQGELVASGEAAGVVRSYRFEVVEHDTWEEFQAAAPARLVSAARDLSGGMHAGENF